MVLLFIYYHYRSTEANGVKHGEQLVGWEAMERVRGFLYILCIGVFLASYV